MLCKNQLKLPGVIFFNIDSYPPIHAFNCSQACFLKFSLVSLIYKPNIKTYLCIECTSETSFSFFIFSFNNQIRCRAISWSRITPFFAKFISVLMVDVMISINNKSSCLFPYPPHDPFLRAVLSTRHALSMQM